jgi:hypothetical protein
MRQNHRRMATAEDRQEVARTGPRRPAALAVVAEADVRARAYRHWEAAGRPAGDGVEFWLAAERELSSGHGPGGR